MEKLYKAHGMKVIMLNKVKQFPESLRNSIGLVTLIILIFFTFFILNIFYGPDKNVELKIAAQKKVQEKANELIETLPRGVLTFYQSDKGQMLSAEEYKIVCNNTKIITQRAIMVQVYDGANWISLSQELPYTTDPLEAQGLVGSVQVINKGAIVVTVG